MPGVNRRSVDESVGTRPLSNGPGGCWRSIGRGIRVADRHLARRQIAGAGQLDFPLVGPVCRPEQLHRRRNICGTLSRGPLRALARFAP